MTSERPTCIVLAGPNGAGKSTIYRNLSLPGVFVNADNLARELDPATPASVSVRAGRLVLKRLVSLIRDRLSFTYETTLSSHQSVRVLQDASSAGYQTVLIFVVLATVELHVLRVAQRHARGGHNIPENVIRRRYGIAFENLSACIPTCDLIWIFDNSGEGARLVLEIQNKRISLNQIDPRSPLDIRIANCVALGLGVSVEAILTAAD
jgi:predicted ABC-type ATPase